MKFIATADTDIGISKRTNQDSVLIRHSKYDSGEVLLAIICDGMGGLAKGELASATVIREMSKWFDKELPYELENIDFDVIGSKLSLKLKKLNGKIMEYSASVGAGMGTTFSGILMVNDRYVAIHVGDTRIYYIDNDLEQLTTDQTFVAREVRRGNMTLEQAKTDKRRNLLLQCVGASEVVEPEILTGKVKHGVYMICSDGFRHEISEAEMYEKLNPDTLVDQRIMHSNSIYLIEQVKNRQEKDNISVVLIKVE